MLRFRAASAAGFRSCASHGEKPGRKKFSVKIQRNPLKRLNSDERIKEIQGNPTPINKGFRSETAASQENPNWSTC
jgi:hypothetical protein